MNATARLQTALTLGEAETDLLAIMITRYTTVAGIVLLIYDCLLTIGDEIRLVWPGPLTAAKLLYYINRYVSIVGVVVSNYHIAGFRPPLSTELCRTWLAVTGTLQLVSTFAATAMLCLRVVALYDHMNWLRGVLWASFISSYVAIFALLVPTYKMVQKDVTYSPLTNICLLLNIPSYAYAVYLGPTAFEVFVIILTVIKAFENAATLRSRSEAPILFAVIRDGLLYFLIITILRVVTSVIWTVLPRALAYLGTNASWSFESTLMSRFFLNLRSVAYDNQFLASRTTTGFALDDASPRTLMMKIMRRKPIPGDGDRTSAANIDCEAGREMELSQTEGQ